MLVPPNEDPGEVYKAESCQPGLCFLRSTFILQQESPIYSLHILVGAWESLRSLPQPPSHLVSVLAVSAEGSQACAKGCELCSEVNGCLKCSPKLFILLERNDIRQVGVCLPSCPPGYFDARNPDMNKCISECGQDWGRAPETPTPGEGAWNCWWPARGVGGLQERKMRLLIPESGCCWPDISPDIPSTFPTLCVGIRTASPPSRPAPTIIPTGQSVSQATTQTTDLRASLSLVPFPIHPITKACLYHLPSVLTAFVIPRPPLTSPGQLQ